VNWYKSSKSKRISGAAQKSVAPLIFGR